MKPTFFLMIISGRSGSSYLRELVNQDSRILMLGEMLVKKDISQQKEVVQNFFEGKIGNNNHPVEKNFLGFKTKLNDVGDRSWFLDLIKQRNPKIVVNRRRNYLRQAISRERMLVLLKNTRKKYGESHHSPKCQDDIVNPIKININSICKSIKNFEKRDKNIDKFCNSLDDQVTTNK